MNEQEYRELDQLKKQLRLFQTQLDGFGVRLDRLSARLAADKGVESEQKPIVPEPEKTPLFPVPPLPVRTVPPPLPPVIPEVAVSVSSRTSPVPESPVPTEVSLSQRTAAAPPEPLPVASPLVLPTREVQPEAKPETSFELKLGTYWLVRLGVVMLLTGLVWAGYYAYDNLHLGPAGKLGLLYLASGLLFGVGAWLQRDKEKEGVRGFGQVVFAGGLAAIYFTTYAAHYSEALRVIQSSVLAGALLLGWTAFIVWLADRRKSEVLALFALGLAYYTAVITRIGLFTLYSNLILTVASVFFLVRNRWAGLSIGSLVATYASFVFWRFYNGESWLWGMHQSELQLGNYFLTGYWVVFTAAGFLAHAEKLGKASRAAFTGTNNLAYFALVVVSMLHVDHGNFWRFAIGLGAGLIGLSALAARVLREEKAMRLTYLVQGLLLVTIGAIAKFSGLTLALLLALECATLCVLGDILKNRVLQAGAYLAGLLSLAWAVPGWEAGTGLITTAAVSGLLLFNAVWITRRNAAADAQPIRLAAGYFSALGLLVLLVATWRHAPWECRMAAFALEGLVLTLSWHLLKVREITVQGQFFLVASQVLWLGHSQPVPWWNPAIIVAAAVAVSHWWQHQKSMLASLAGRNVATAVFGLLTAGAILIWGQPHFTPDGWLAATSLLGIAFICYGLATRTWALAGLGPLFMGASVWQFVALHSDGRSIWQYALAPIVTLVVTAAVAGNWLDRRQDARAEVRRWIQALVLLYRLAATFLGIWWIYEYVGVRDQLWVLSLVAAALCVVSLGRNKAQGLSAHAIFMSVSVWQFIKVHYQGQGQWLIALSPVAVLVGAAFLADALLRRRPELQAGFQKTVGELAIAYRAVASFLSIWWIYEYVPASAQIWVLALVGTLIFLGSMRRGAIEGLAHHAVYALCSLVAFALVYRQPEESVSVPNLLAILALLGLQQFARHAAVRIKLPEFWHHAAILLGGFGLWLLVARWTILRSSGEHFYLTAAWAGVALTIFAAGFWLRERMYRWLGLGILACALVRVGVSDIWKLQTIYRILSFVALGVVLLVLGFLYNKYQQKIREWL